MQVQFALSLVDLNLFYLSFEECRLFLQIVELVNEICNLIVIARDMNIKHWFLMQWSTFRSLGVGDSAGFYLDEGVIQLIFQGIEIFLGVTVLFDNIFTLLLVCYQVENLLL